MTRQRRPEGRPRHSDDQRRPGPFHHLAADALLRLDVARAVIAAAITTPDLWDSVDVDFALLDLLARARRDLDLATTT